MITKIFYLALATIIIFTAIILLLNIILGIAIGVSDLYEDATFDNVCSFDDIKSAAKEVMPESYNYMAPTFAIAYAIIKFRLLLKKIFKK
jgi:hypothetical protein